MTKAKIWFTALGIAALLSLSLPGCSTVPVSGRSQLNFISPAQEMELGLTAFEKMKSELPVSQNAAVTAMVRKVGERIAKVAEPHMPQAQWEFVVFESEEANAFCLPGGKVGIYTGILSITKDEAGLATVVGHEVAHAVASHGAERISEQILMDTGGQLLGVALSNADPKVQSASNVAFGLGTQLGRALPHTRRQEAEADYMGLMFMAGAGYNPEASLAFWQRFAEQASDGGVPWFLRTHPVTQTRIENLRAAMPEAQAEYRRVTESAP